MIIDWLETRHPSANAVVLYLFCSYNENESQSAQNLLASLLKQVLLRQSVIPQGVRDLYERHVNRKSRPGVGEITPLLLEELKGYSSVFVVIDALDECSDRDDTRKALLAEVQKLPQDSHILITSRYSPNIEEAFKDVPAIEIRATDDDVKRYIEGRVKQESRLAKHIRSDPGLMDDIKSNLLQSCRGM